VLQQPQVQLGWTHLPLPSAAASDGRYLPTLWSSSSVRSCRKGWIPLRKGSVGQCTHNVGKAGNENRMHNGRDLPGLWIGQREGSVAVPGRRNDNTIL